MLSLSFCIELQHIQVGIDIDCYFVENEPLEEFVDSVCPYLLSPSHALLTSSSSFPCPTHLILLYLIVPKYIFWGLYVIWFPYTY